MEMKEGKQHKEKNAHNVSEPQARYNIDVNALKLAGINALMSINNPVILEKTVKSLIETASPTRKSTIVIEEQETIGKEEILANIREALLEIKERKRTGQKGIHLQELINEL
ncbi:MAG: hypothetical protein VB074_04550 [Proteiniphilum sp.]|jgi:hypothetical protein|uniref:hypothetical protein n=1 Tax=Proteiniphilum sp. TaxID=1926877 RepID=UPI002B1E9835|nr:hypothetical protein [Proteiniphilum sp.]MEA5127431.1 hypothetical protein [Proteiniphilum sp.]